MPLVRVEVRNEFGLGRRELYREGAVREDPKAVLEGVAVAGLTGILRQLGDLSELAAEVFHSLQEQISMTSSRSHKLIARTQRLDAALPSLEKLVLAQTSHIHFAYTAGSEWHARCQGAQHHFIDNDLPRFIMDSYEECRDPPHLHLLDKFDPGGAGSCLRRYSDPTFFRRVSTIIDENNSLKFRMEKKARKMKKKRSLSKNAGFAHGASRFNPSSRLQFSSPIMSGLSSPAASVSDSIFKSDAGHGVNSSGMTMRSGYIECIINHRNEMQPEEQESSRSSSSRLELHDDTVNSVSTLEGSPAVGGYFMQKEHKEGSTSVQSSITWDEKAEIVVDAEEYKHELNEAATEAEVPTSSSLSSGKAISEKIEKAHISHHDNDNTKPSFPVNSADDADSGPDNYEDALNAIDTESEGDVECQTNQEVMQFFTDVDIKEIGVTRDVITTNNSDFSPSNIEDDSSYWNPPVEVSCLQTSEPASSDIGDGGVIRQIPEGFANSDSPPQDAMSQSVDAGNIETLESVGSESTLHHNLSEKLVEHQESPSKIPGVQFWTNGGLLGLQPSKPPDFAALNAPSSGSGVRFIDTGISNNDLDEKPARPVKIAECIEREICEPSIADSSTSHNDEISKASSTGNAGAKLETVCGNWKSYPNGDESTSTIVMVPGNLVPVAPTSNIAQNESHRGTEENFSSILGLGQKLLANSLSFRKKISANSDEGSNPACLSKSTMHNHGSQFPEGSRTDSLSAFKEQFQNAVAANQHPPSPPLEHMKISFRPMIGFSASSLRLKFPYSTDRQDSSRDMFASFQLVPESTIPFQDVCFNSDDGTFCRSSPRMSDDSASRLSASDSDEWESNNSSKEKEHDNHDSVQRLSSSGSVSQSQEQQGIALDRRFGSMQSESGEDPIASFSLRELSLDLPSFESMNSPTVQEHNLHAHPSNHKMQDTLQSTPQSPPCPPVNRKNLQLLPNGSEIMQVLENDLLNRHAASETSEPDMFLHPKVDPAWPRHNSQEITGVTLKSKDHRNLNANVPEANERGDFLHQIRAKSFSLRPTVPRPMSNAAATANFEVATILLKANAIRQAVGSEDGDDDDSWSDNV